MPANTKAIVQKVNAAFAENNLEGFLSYCADDISFTMVGDRTIKGKDGVRKWIASMDMEPPRFTAEHVIADGDFATSHGEMTMKDKDGKTGQYAYCDVYRFRGDKIVELTAFVMKTEAKREVASV